MFSLDQNIEGGDRSGDQIKHDFCQSYSNSDPDQTSQTSDPCCLTHEKAKGLGSGEAHTSENSNLSPPLDDGDGDGIVDQKHSNDDGDETESSQVEVKSRNHFFNLTTPGIGST